MKEKGAVEIAKEWLADDESEGSPGRLLAQAVIEAEKVFMRVSSEWPHERNMMDEWLARFAAEGEEKG